MFGCDTGSVVVVLPSVQSILLLVVLGLMAAPFVLVLHAAVRSPARRRLADQQPGWRVDPTGRQELRWWDGDEWSIFVTQSGVTSTDPF